jgi:hypothetical protein
LKELTTGGLQALLRDGQLVRRVANRARALLALDRGDALATVSYWTGRAGPLVRREGLTKAGATSLRIRTTNCIIKRDTSTDYAESKSGAKGSILDHWVRRCINILRACDQRDLLRQPLHPRDPTSPIAAYRSSVLPHSWGSRVVASRCSELIGQAKPGGLSQDEAQLRIVIQRWNWMSAVLWTSDHFAT